MTNRWAVTLACLLPSAALAACDGLSLVINPVPTLTVHGTVTTAAGAPVIGAVIEIRHYAAGDCSGIALDTGFGSTGPSGGYEVRIRGTGPRITGCLEARVSSHELGEAIETRPAVDIPLDGDEPRYRFDVSY